MNSYKDIKEIILYKRNIESIEEIDEYKIEITKNQAIFYKGNNKNKEVDLNDINDKLNDLLELVEPYYDSPFRAELYEFNKDDLMLKMFLIIKFNNKTYLAIKGDRPFSQINYKEINALLSSLINVN